MNKKILVVDDDANLLAAMQRNLREQFAVDTALGGNEALTLLHTHGPFAVVLADMNMPGMNGIELLERVQALSPDTVGMMLTGNVDQQTAVEAVNRGQVFRFLTKPTPPEVLLAALEAGLNQYARTRQEREILEGTLVGSINLLTDVLGMAAREALGRGQRLRDSVTRFARYLGAPSIWELELGALLSSIGCTAVPSGILRKVAANQPLLPEEAAVLSLVPKIGRDLLVAIPRLTEVAEIVLYQHKHYDGSGFPEDGVAGEVIPLGARILAILHDRLELEEDGMATVRIHETMHARTGHYDPQLLDQSFRCFPRRLMTAVSSVRPVVERSVAELEPGDIVVSDILTMGGITLVSPGSILTSMMIARLNNFRQLSELQEPLLILRSVAPQSSHHSLTNPLVS